MLAVAALGRSALVDALVDVRRGALWARAVGGIGAGETRATRLSGLAVASGLSRLSWSAGRASRALSARLPWSARLAWASRLTGGSWWALRTGPARAALAVLSRLAGLTGSSWLTRVAGWARWSWRSGGSLSSALTRLAGLS